MTSFPAAKAGNRFAAAAVAYVTGGALFVGFLLILFFRTQNPRPWRGYLVRVQLVAGVAGIGIVIGAARSPVTAFSVVLALYLFVLWAERRLFFRAVRKGRVEGLALRDPLPEDADLVTCEINGRRRTEVLERLPGQDRYRESARAEPIYRIVHRPKKRTFVLVATTLVLGVLLATAMLTMRSRKFEALDRDHLESAPSQM